MKKLMLEREMREKMDGSQVINPYHWRDRISTKAMKKDRGMTNKITQSPN